jgi:hypothetical protein
MNTHIVPPPGMNPRAAIFMVEEQFFLVADVHGEIRQKFIAPGAVRQAFAAEPIDSGWLPAGVRRWGMGVKGVWMLRHHPPATYNVWLPDRKRPLRAPMPGLVFFAQGSSYYMWAVKGDTFDPKAPLWNAPCANVSGLGLICWGTNPHPDVATGCFDQLWNVFWDAPFSGSWATGKSVKFPKDASARLLDLAKRKTRRYPEADLTPLKNRLLPKPCTLDAVVELFTRRGADELDNN